VDLVTGIVFVNQRLVVRVVVQAGLGGIRKLRKYVCVYFNIRPLRLHTIYLNGAERNVTLRYTV
jgi:hypothetical protein